MATFAPRIVMTRFPAQYSSMVAVVLEMGSSTRRTRCSGRGNNAVAANAAGAARRDSAATTLRTLPPPRQCRIRTGTSELKLKNGMDCFRSGGDATTTSQTAQPPVLVDG